MSTSPQAVCLLVRKGDLFLGVTRRNQPDTWGLPGGKVDAGEGLIGAVIRETYEETGLVIRATEVTQSFQTLCGPGSDGKTFEAYGYTFTGDPSRFCTNERWEVEAGIGVGWVSKAQLFAGPFGDYNRAFFDALGL
jgi:8-oxo-dGTP pyrophosphatase MutT (NUDIX family)